MNKSIKAKPDEFAARGASRFRRPAMTLCSHGTSVSSLVKPMSLSLHYPPSPQPL